MQKPKAAKPTFLAHFLHGQGAITERRVDARGTINFDVVMVRGPNRTVEFLATGVGNAEIPRFHAMLDKFEILAKAQQKAGPFDALQLAKAGGDQLDLSQILSLRLIAEYTSAALIYASNIAGYLALPAAGRFQAGVSLDLYRQALSFHDVENIDRLVNEEGPIVLRRRMNNHACETVFDALFHLARRIGNREAAFEFLSRSWAAKHTIGRAFILLEDAVYYRRSALIVEIAAFLEEEGQMSARQMAQVAVAQARLGQTDAAMATFTRLAAQKGETAQILTDKIAKFLGVAPR